MADLEAELARFEAELAAVERSAGPKTALHRATRTSSGAEHTSYGTGRAPASQHSAPTQHPPQQLYGRPPTLLRPPPPPGAHVQHHSGQIPVQQSRLTPAGAAAAEYAAAAYPGFAAGQQEALASPMPGIAYSIPGVATTNRVLAPPAAAAAPLVPIPASAEAPTASAAQPGTGQGEASKKKTGKLRQAAGKRWLDPSLGEWPDNDFRIFVGDMGNEVTDDMLAKAFSRYASFAKAKIVRDKRSNKSKGFGFVSFLDGNDFAKAMKEMNGKYIGNRPCKLRKSTWDERNATLGKRKNEQRGRLNKRHHIL